ncbi:MAG: aldehyde dehydrogenase family protein [Bacteroidota bacterium]
METFPMYVAGEFRMTSQEIMIINPFTSEVFARASRAESEDLEFAIQKGLVVEKEMASMSVYLRREILLQIAEGITRTHDRFTSLIVQECGKPWKYASAEVDRAIATFIIAAEETKRWPAEHLSIDWTAAGLGKEAWLKYFPIGLVAGISPFNFPLNLAVHKLAPAIAAACPIILKPSSSTPLSMLELARVIDTTALPKGAVSILPMDRALGNTLASDLRFKLLSFTGSPAVGWKLKNESGRKHVVLELGGNAGVIVSDSADLNLAVRKCVMGAFSYSGQVCIHTQRIFVHASVFKEFCERFVAQSLMIKTGDPMDPTTDISVMIDEKNAIRVESWVNEALNDGAKLLCGGKRQGAYYPPTVLMETKPEMKVCSLEVFGPVVTIEPYHDFAEAVRLINQSEYGLQAGVFTDRLSEMNLAFAELEVGGVIINDVPTFRVDHMPYGGVKNSGQGREGVKYAMVDMLEPKLLVKNT